MANSGTRIIAFLRVTRVANSLMVFAATLIGGLLSMSGQIVAGSAQLIPGRGWFVGKSGGLLAGSEELPSVGSELGTIFIAATSMFFLAAFGYAFNDYYDAQADQINRPSRPIPSGALPRKTVLGVVVFCAFVTAVVSFFLRPALGLSLAGIGLLVWLYSARIKRTGLPGNVLVGFFAGFTLLFGGFAAGDVRPALFPALLAFLVNLPREILKDIQDLEGDGLAGSRSVASERGRIYALRLASVCALILVVLTFVPYLMGLYNHYYLAIAILLDAFLVWTAVRIWNPGAEEGAASERRGEAVEAEGEGAVSSREPGRSSSLEAERSLATTIRILKLTMLGGLLAIVLGSF